MTDRSGNRRNRFSLKGVLLIMGLITTLAGLIGCTKKPDAPVAPDGPEIEAPPMPDIDFGEEGDDFSKEGPGEYRKVSGLEFRVGGYTPGFSYYIEKSDEDDSKTVLTFQDGEKGYDEHTCEVDSETMEKISKLCEQLNILSWNGFNRTMKGVLDGSGFSLSIKYDDGTYISAHGSNSFPKNFSEFRDGFRDIMAPTVEAELARVREELFATGAFSQKLTFAMIDYAGRGASGSDSYNFLVRESSSSAQKIDFTVKSVSGEFIEPDTYRFYENPDNTDELLEKIQEVLAKYEVYKWDGYDKSTPDYSDREWFQLSFSYPEARINCCGCGDTEHYAEVRQELITLLVEYMKENLIE